MLAEQNVIQREITKHDEQFISVTDIINLISKCLTNTHTNDIYSWLELHQDEFNKAFPLIKVKANKIIPYSLYIQTFFDYGHSSPKISPIECLEFVISGGYIEDFEMDYDYPIENFGFSKYKTLHILQSLNIKISPKYWKNVTPYIPPRSKIDNLMDNYYFERLDYFEDLVKHLSQEKIKEPEYSKLPFKIEVILKANYYIHTLGHYSGEKSYTDKVKCFLEDMAHQDIRYNRVKHLPTFRDTIVNALRSETREYMSNLKK